ncbi:hypothetical protein R1sor_016390 [Riccia sorocarpa]|uniref:Uncharacterized protein n=1 Tax=Riccia sorocarpa TaxID=122646 RepID=A0ABD3HGW1_9MARC
MNEAISKTPQLAEIPISLNGDIRTTTVKRKSSYGTGIMQNDTHRHDKVAKTQQAMKFVRGRLQFGPELDDPTCYARAAKTAIPAGTSNIVAQNCTASPVDVLEPTTTKTANPAGTTNTVAQNYTASPVYDHEPTTTKTAKSSGKIVAANCNASPEYVPELTTPTATTHAGTFSTRHGLNVNAASTYRGLAEVAGPTICPAYHEPDSLPTDPCGPQCKTQMPPVPTVIPVQIGTGLTHDEVDFVTSNGFVLVRRTHVQMSKALPSESEIKVLVDAYPKRVHDFPRDHRFKDLSKADTFEDLPNETGEGQVNSNEGGVFMDNYIGKRLRKTVQNHVRTRIFTTVHCSDLLFSFVLLPRFLGA